MILPAQAIRRAAPIAEMVERRKVFGLTYGLGERPPEDPPEADYDPWSAAPRG